MDQINRRVALLLVVCYSPWFIPTAASVETFYFDNRCNPNITDPQTFYYFIGSPTDGSNSSGILKSSLTNYYFPNVTCNAVLTQIGNSGVTVSIRRIALGGDCRENISETITFTNSEGLSDTFCGSVEQSDEAMSFSSNGPLTVQFKTGSEPPSVTKGGFQISFTSFRSTPCPGVGFQCQNKRCIWEGLRCDGHNNCGDLSDEARCGLPVGAIIGIVLGFLVIFLVITSVIVYRRRRAAIKHVVFT